jgi:hypothetical protein
MRAKLTREEHRIADGIAEHGLCFDRDFMLEDGNADLFFLYYFPREFYSAVLERPHFEDMNYRVINVLENERRCVIQLPGGHGKTTTVRHWIPYVFCREPNVSMMYVEKSEPIAQAAARNIMNMLVTNERLIEDFGSFRGDFWSAQRFTIRQRTESISTPSLVVYGAGSKGTLGTRANIIIVDDPVTEEHAVSELERERLWAWWSQAATTVPYPLPLSKHDRYLNKLFLIGTSFHLDDLYHRVVQQGGFDHLLLKAVDETTGECLSHRFCWEEEKTLAERAKADESAASLLKMIRDGKIINLKAFRDEQGSIAFYRRYQNEPFDPSKQVFNRLWLIGGHDVLSPSTGYPGCLDETASFGEDKQDGWVYWTGVDPSSGGSTAKWAANFACITLGYNPNDPQKLIHLVDMDYGDYPLLSDNPSRTTQADIVLDHVRRYNSRLVVETNAQQHAHVSVYRSEARKKNVTLLITGHYTSLSRKINFKDGVPAIAPYFENGQVQIPYRRPEDKRRAQQFIEEAVNYPLYATDDCLMAFWMAWMRIDSLLKQNRQSVITKVERPAYFNRRQAEINFPPHWTSKQREAYLLGNSPEELEEAEEVMAV